MFSPFRPGYQAPSGVERRPRRAERAARARPISLKDIYARIDEDLAELQE
jgi:hypothetical protein